MKTDVDGESAQPAVVATDAAGQRAEPHIPTWIVLPEPDDRPLRRPPGARVPRSHLSRSSPARSISTPRLIPHLTVLVLIALAGLGARAPWVQSLTASGAAGRGFQERILLVRPRYRMAPPQAQVVSGLDVGYVRRVIPPETADTVALAEDAFAARGGSTFIDAGFVMVGLDAESTTSPLPRTQPVKYAVRSGDTLWTIGQKFDLDADTLAANNELANPNVLSLGTELLVPPVDGLWYEIKSGDTIEALAQRFKTTAQAILDFAPNGLADGDKLAAGEKIMIPGGRKPAPVRTTRTVVAAAAKTVAGSVAGVGSFIMPTTGRFTQGFWARHPAIDIGAPKGTPVYAADGGVVSFAGWHPWGYGYAVEIDHGNGYKSLYAHLSWYAPDAGQTVKRGELIGGVGSTYGSGGYSSGPHLHFEVVQNGVKRNPCAFVACP